MAPEFSRPERIDTIGEGRRDIVVDAGVEERQLLAARFALVSVERLTGRFTVQREARGIAVAGRVTAQVVQACSVTGEPIPAEVDEEVHLLFVEPSEQGEEVELSGDAVDTIEIEGGAIDLGEAAAESMALALDPFPRSAAAAAALAEAGVLTEEQAQMQSGPFAALAALKTQGKG